MEQKLRKYQSILGISGIATIVFGVWGIIKTILFMVLDPYRIDGSTIDIKAMYLQFIIWVIVYVVIDLFLRVFVGLSARAESKGKKTSILYLIFAGILIIVSLFWIIRTFLLIKEIDLMDILTSVIIDLISLFALTETLIYGIKLKKLKG